MTAEAAGTAKDDAPPVRGLTPDEDERLRGLIRAELDRQHAMPLARRTLELLAEAEVEPSREEPGYRVIDRNGETRLLRDGDAGPEERGDLTAPMTLRGLVSELRERHPDLFAPPPEPEKLDPIPAPPPEPPHDALAEVKAAGARFVETQSALARTLATTSAEHGRTFATAASGRVEGWRKRLGERFGPKPVPAPVAREPAEKSQPVPQPSDPGRPARAEGSGGSGLAGLIRRGRDAVPAFDRHAFDLHRTAFIGLAIATALLVGAVVVAALRRDAGSPAETPRVADNRAESRTAARDAPKETAAPPSRPAGETAPPAPEAKPAGPDAAPEDAEAAPVEEPPRNPNDVVGVPQVIDTATMRVSGKIIHLFGVEWVRGGQADELTKYIRGRTVTCRPAQGSSAFLCSIEGRDLSEVVLFNGGGRASSEASPDLVAAEDHARTERLGVWKR